ncbi:MAG TPA: 3D domain-containing protein [Fimbriimonadales bacterium]|nr:3D domain-containing protein [Fimbriimonadales bacterium]
MKPYIAVAISLLAVGFAYSAKNQKDLYYETRLVKKELPYSTVYLPDRTLPPGRMKKVENGHMGKAVQMLQITTQKGRVIGKRVLWTKTISSPKDAVYRVGIVRDISRKRFVRAKVLVMEATAYSSQDAGVGTRTAMGLRAIRGVAAVDPKVIPFGTHLFIEGYGYAIAADKGSAIKRNRIDLCFNTRNEAIRFGTRKVRVHILK